ncbi:MAG TPA: RNA polymerase sigma factor [Bryobacteraceae bacterium]|nr:RNA polymerase sigma factor [Bryobacteraceae bacterium]
MLTGKGEATTGFVSASAATIDEADLIRAAQSGDQGAFESLVHSYDHGVLRLACNLVRNEQDAFDIYQETFLRVFRNLHAFRFDCSFRTWLYRIVTNLCLDHLRKRKVRKEEGTTMTLAGGDVDRTAVLAEENPLGDPQRHLLSAQLRGRIEQVLSGLTPRERMVFEMRHYQGMRLRAIGETLGTTEEAAKNCLFRATQKMRSSLGDFI